MAVVPDPMNAQPSSSTSVDTANFGLIAADQGSLVVPR